MSAKLYRTRRLPRPGDLPPQAAADDEATPPCSPPRAPIRDEAVSDGDTEVVPGSHEDARRKADCKEEQTPRKRQQTLPPAAAAAGVGVRSEARRADDPLSSSSAAVTVVAAAAVIKLEDTPPCSPTRAPIGREDQGMIRSSCDRTSVASSAGAASTLPIGRYASAPLQDVKKPFAPPQEALRQLAVAPPQSAFSDQLDEGQQRAFGLAMTGANMFLTGGPGTGKSFTLLKIIAALKKTHGNSGVLVAAPTGVAALIAEGQTLHSKPGPGIPKGTTEAFGNMRSWSSSEIWKRVRCLVIDEVSMVDLFKHQRHTHVLCCAALVVIVTGVVRCMTGGCRVPRLVHFHRLRH